MLQSYGFHVGPMYLGIVHPELPSGRCVEVPDLKDEVEAMVDAEREAGRAD
jgi:hypothetical protein